MTTATIPSPSPTITASAPCSSRRSTPSTGGGPSQRLVSLYHDADRARAAAIEAEAQRLQQEVDAKTSKYVAAALEKELQKFPEPLRAKLRAARADPAREAHGRAEDAHRHASQPEPRRRRALPVQPGRGRRAEEGPGAGQRQARREAGRGFRERSLRAARQCGPRRTFFTGATIASPSRS